MKRLLGAAVSAFILWLLWQYVDVERIGAAARASDPFWLAAGLSMAVPLTLCTAWRFRLLSRSTLTLGSATRLILSSSTLNLFLPSKMGDIAKAHVLTARYGYGGRRALAVVVLEKLLDLASLLAWGVVALLWVGRRDPVLLLAAGAIAALLALLVLLILPLPAAPRLMRFLSGVLPGKLGRTAAGFSAEWAGHMEWFWSDRTRAVGVLLMSLGLWAAHLAQFWLFCLALRATVPFIDNMVSATLSILVGLAPFTMAGIGTRDAAILFFYREWLTPGQGALLGVLATTRYLMPAIAGVPFLREYLPPKRAAAQ